MPNESSASPTTLGNVLSALEFHTIAAIFIFEFLVAAKMHMIGDCDTARFQR